MIDLEKELRGLKRKSIFCRVYATATPVIQGKWAYRVCTVRDRPCASYQRRDTELLVHPRHWVWEPCDKWGEPGPQAQADYLHYLVKCHTYYGSLDEMVRHCRSQGPDFLPKLICETSKQSKAGLNYLYRYLLTLGIKILVGDHV